MPSKYRYEIRPSGERSWALYVVRWWADYPYQTVFDDFGDNTYACTATFRSAQAARDCLQALIWRTAHKIKREKRIRHRAKNTPVIPVPPWHDAPVNDWPASRGTTHQQLIAMHLAAEDDPNGRD